ncbi:MAG: signal recognition particle subunit SRP19/SEC65 family protein [Thermofilum sp.]
MKKREGFIIWLAYFDARYPRSKGRRVPKALAVEKPTLSELEEAAKRAGLQVLAVEGNAKYPACWFEEPGRILVRAEGRRKSQVVTIIAKELVEVRKARQLQRRKP